jgi:outer membrane immunogenic protein
MMFKITVVAAATLAAFASVGAHAQEDRWSGVYVGAHGAWADGKVKDVSNPQASTQDIDGWQGGVQVGFNKQSGNFLFGVEGDATFGKSEKKWLDRETGGSQFSAYYGADSIRTSGTVRARAGIAGEKALVYLTGGLAIADTRHGFGCKGSLQPAAIGRCRGNGDDDFYTSEKKTRFGYVVGGGVELAVTDNVSIKGEYNYLDYGKANVSLTDPIDRPNTGNPAQPYVPITGDRKFDISNHMAKVGVNFRF